MWCSRYKSKRGVRQAGREGKGSETFLLSVTATKKNNQSLFSLTNLTFFLFPVVLPFLVAGWAITALAPSRVLSGTQSMWTVTATGFVSMATHLVCILKFARLFPFHPAAHTTLLLSARRLRPSSRLGPGSDLQHKHKRHRVGMFDRHTCLPQHAKRFQYDSGFFWEFEPAPKVAQCAIRHKLRHCLHSSVEFTLLILFSFDSPSAYSSPIPFFRPKSASFFCCCG